MFCMQCEQTEKGTGCTVVGVCGKTPTVAGLQDLMVDNIKGLSMWLHRARQVGIMGVGGRGEELKYPA